jgi:2-polyprenyl-6-methoxyphenol hydroxylase-like FAD-dependent oxidoreductase
MLNVSFSQHRAIVIGGSIAGLLSARVLLNHFEQVVLIERDSFDDRLNYQQVRSGVPQSPHVHILLSKGHQILDEFFPGLMDDLGAAGAPEIDWFADWMTYNIRGWRPRGPSSLTGRACSRDLLETHIRQHLIEKPGFVLLDRAQVKGLQYQPETKTVTGVEFKRLHENTVEPLSANFVVDASGRNSLLPQWLEELGYTAPQETIVNAFLGYATRWYQAPPDLKADWRGITLWTAPGENSRGGVLYRAEENRWLVTLAGVGRDYPPTDDAGFLEFAASLRHPIVHDLIKQAEPLSEIYSYRRTENRWRHYDRISLPDGIVAIGDAVCVFNPIYGQGMTTAALGAMILDRGLTNGRHKGFSSQFQKQLAAAIETPWKMATGEDSHWSTTEGAQSSWVSRIIQGYIDRMLLVAATNIDVSRTFVEVIHMVKKPTALFHPIILFAVLRSFWNSSN